MAQHAILRFEKHKGHPAGPLEAHHERKKEQYASNPDIDTSRSKYNFHIVKPDGKYRLSDLYKEHNHQCDQLKNIIESFRNGRKAYKTSELIDFLDEKFLKPVDNPIFIENVKVNSALDIAHFLYRIGFITLDDDSFDNGKSFIRFEDIPDLLIPSNYNPNDIWAIHPSYRTILHLS